MTALPAVDTVLDALEFEVPCSVVVRRVLELRLPFGWCIRRTQELACCGESALAVLKCRTCGRSDAACSTHLVWLRDAADVACGHCQRRGEGLFVFAVTPFGGTR